MASTEEQGAKLYSAVERIVEDPNTIIERVERFEDEIDEEIPDLSDDELVDKTAEKLITYFANRTMTTGGLTSLPGIIPFWGSIIAVVGGGLADMTFCLKYEVEMVLSLSALYGFDIRDDKERGLAFLIASVSTYEQLDGKSNIFKGMFQAVGDYAQTQSQAVWNYTPRQIGKIVAKAFVQLAIKGASKSLLKAMPLVGIGISAAGNRILTKHVGVKSLDALRYRLASEKY
ncbi:MAG: EcsC family protein [Planctomycetota bacterium]|nr:EcsC family protein [Planctomycetota bacterium]